MPAKLVRCVDKVMAKGMPKSSAWPICVKSTGLSPHKKKNESLPRKLSKSTKGY